MRSPKTVLENLQRHSLDKSYKYERLYRNLYNHDFYLLAYQNVYANKGAMTPGIDGLTLDGYGNERINNLIDTLKTAATNQLLPADAIYRRKTERCARWAYRQPMTSWCRKSSG